MYEPPPYRIRRWLMYGVVLVLAGVGLVRVLLAKPLPRPRRRRPQVEEAPRTRSSAAVIQRRTTTTTGSTMTQPNFSETHPPQDEQTQQKASRRSVIAAVLAASVFLALAIAGAVAMHVRREFPIEPRWHVPGADIERGRQAILVHGCGACHVIPNVRGATGRVGPRLEGLREQIYIAGRLPNVPDNLAAWIQDPQHFDPHNAMPNLGLTETEARDIAAYLYSVP